MTQKAVFSVTFVEPVRNAVEHVQRVSTCSYLDRQVSRARLVIKVVAVDERLRSNISKL